MSSDPTKPVRIDPHGIYDDGALVLSLGLTHAALRRARRAGSLRHTRSGRRILYLGQWVLDWFEGEPNGIDARRTRSAP
jgi:hypothetical protein